MRYAERTFRAIGIPSLLVVLGLLTAVAACDQKTGRFFIPVAIEDGLDPTTGDIFGQVTVDGIPRSGVTVTVSRNGTVVDTAVTDTNGEYEFLELDPGTYTVSIGTISGATCPGEQTAQVVADVEREVDFACTSTPTTGTVTGTVNLDGSPVEGVTVALDGRTATTDANGMFSFTMVDPGSYAVTASISGAECPPQTTTVSANMTSTITIECTTSGLSGSEIAAVDYSLMGTIMGTDGCGIGMTISNPGPIDVESETMSGSTFVTIVSDANVRGMYLPGQPWTGTGETTISSGTMTFTLRESVMGTWVRQGGLVTLSGTLLFEIFDGTTKVCESGYDATYQQLTASSHRFKRDVTYLLPEGSSILGLRPVGFRYRAAYGDAVIPRLGLIAEDVARVYPGAVALDGLGRPMGIAYGILRALVVEEARNRVQGAVTAGIARLATALQ